MSRIGKKIINVPKNTEVAIDKQGVFSAKGPKGMLSRKIHSSMNVLVKDAVVTVVPVKGESADKNFHGLTRSLINNMVVGVSDGYTKKLLLRGVGYRAAVSGSELQLTLGYSHPINFKIPEGIQIKVDKLGKDPMVVVTGYDKEVVGQTAADIRSFRKPEPYHGKGVRYVDEVIITKVGKSSGKK